MEDRKKTPALYRLTMSLMTIDLWVLLKARRFVNFITKLLSSLLRVGFVMTLGAGVLLAFILAHVKIDSPIYVDDYSIAKGRPMKEGLLGREKVSDTEPLLLRQKLTNLQNQAQSLELSLKKMGLQNIFSLRCEKDFQNLATDDVVLLSLCFQESRYNDLSKIASNNHRDEELADFASEAAGASVLDTPDTESYYEPWHQQTTLFGIPIWKANYFTPRKVIQPWTQAGECWAFRGSRGKIIIELAYYALIDRVTLEHIPVSASLTGSISSAPRDFVLYGLIDRVFVTLDSFTYNINGPSSQIFKSKKKKLALHPVKTILLEIRSNWGHRDYTCIYRFKVHGKIADREHLGGDYVGEDDNRL